MSSDSSERKSSIFPSVVSFTHLLMFAKSSPFLPIRFMGFAPKRCSDCFRKSSLMGNPTQKGPQAAPGAQAPQWSSQRPEAKLISLTLSTPGHYLGTPLPPAPTFLQVHPGSHSECPRAQVLAEAAQQVGEARPRVCMQHLLQPLQRSVLRTWRGPHRLWPTLGPFPPPLSTQSLLSAHGEHSPGTTHPPHAH